MVADSSFINRQKYKFLDQLLKERFALVHVNCAAAGVKLPAHLLTDPAATLRVSRNFRKPITLEKDSFFTELLFGDEYFLCVIPWEAVWGMSSGEREGVGQMWAESAPAEIAPFMESLEALSKLTAAPAEKGGEQATEPALPTPEPVEQQSSEKRGRPQLKRVK